LHGVCTQDAEIADLKARLASMKIDLDNARKGRSGADDKARVRLKH
jgi:hypothetical protein